MRAATCECSASANKYQPSALNGLDIILGRSTFTKAMLWEYLSKLRRIHNGANVTAEICRHGVGISGNCDVFIWISTRKPSCQTSRCEF